MATALDELTDDILSKRQVQLRLDDWDKRIRHLYGEIARWLEVNPRWQVHLSEEAIKIFEEPMREAGVPSRRFPILDLRFDGKQQARVEPRGLWIIGANGRLDLVGRAATSIIVDAADNFAPARWMIMSSLDRTTRHPLVAERFVAVSNDFLF